MLFKLNGMFKSNSLSRHQKRVEAVRSVMNGEPVSTVARVLRVPHRTIFHWLAKYRKGGWGNLEDGKRSGRPRKLTADVMGWLYNAITQGDPRQYQLPFCLWTLNNIRTVLKREYDIVVSKSSVSRLLGHLGLSPQRPIYRSYKRDPKALEKYLKKTFPEIVRTARRLGADIYFVDEAAVRSDHHRGTTWAPIGETPVVEDSGDRFGIKLISAVSPRGDMRFQIIEGKMNSDKFIKFLEKLRADAGKPIIVIADNASYHKSKKVMEFAKESNEDITMELLPAYAPELNPDEQVWNHAKARLGKLFIDSKESMKQNVLNIMRSIQKSAQLVRSFFKLDSTRYIINECKDFCND
jgi:transposase